MSLPIFSFGQSKKELFSLSVDTILPNNHPSKVSISGYIQPQFQLAQQKGIKSYQGGNFPSDVNYRPTLRRGRLKGGYSIGLKSQTPFAKLILQVDGTERGIIVKELYGHLNENRWKLFSLSFGLFNRPFGHELTLSSSERESPERGRMSQILMKGERDVGVMFSFEPQTGNKLLRNLRWDAGIFNGTGKFKDIDCRKDFITRLYSLPVEISPVISMSGGVSLLYGGFVQNTRYVYKMGEINGLKSFVVDSAERNIGRIAPRNYYGADIELKWRKKGFNTSVVIEYITGTQTGSINSSETPTKVPTGNSGYYIRTFNGAYFYFIQDLFSSKHRLIFKYDWYDPNRVVGGEEIGLLGSVLSEADVKYTTLGVGYALQITPKMKALVWYDHVVNESTLISGMQHDIRDDVLTLRAQYIF